MARLLGVKSDATLVSAQPYAIASTSSRPMAICTAQIVRYTI